ncbi:MAG: uracil-DNA glycosylase [Candidatus Bathyarchaeia archaeon]
MKAKDLDLIADEIRRCQLCSLHRGRINAVPGEGSPNAKLIFIGEAPGAEEDRQGRPFVGAAGKLLNDAMARAGIRREEVFITNVVKCRPPGNREPKKEEAEACQIYLQRQMDVINPRFVCLLGNTAIRALLGSPRPGMRGKYFEKNGRIYFPTLHPAAAIYNPRLKLVLEIHLSRLKGLLDSQS